jgi:hypothetical protein
MISELVTNAILHGGEGAILTILVDDLRIRAEVRDASPAMPVVRSYSETATTGRGMVIVDALAADWGTYAVDGGKVVWFELAKANSGTDGSAADERPAGRRTQRSAGDFGRRLSPALDGESRGSSPSSVRLGLVSGRRAHS